MTPEDEIIHLKHELDMQKGRTARIASECLSYLDDALSALEVNRPHVARERIEVVIQDKLRKLFYDSL